MKADETEPKKQWTAIRDRMPLIHEDVWLSVEGTDRVVAGCSDGERWRTEDVDERHGRAPWTHWMPRESPPTPPGAPPSPVTPPSAETLVALLREGAFLVIGWHSLFGTPLHAWANKVEETLGAE